MASDPEVWRNHSPGNLDLVLDEIHRSDVEEKVAGSAKAWADWKHKPLGERIECLRRAEAALESEKEELSDFISIETGKPIRESRGEISAVLAKFRLAFEDAERFLTSESVNSGPHPARIRRMSRGPAAVIAPFNFPIHLGHGATLAHLLAGNPVLFKPSPLAATVAGKYGALMEGALPDGVFQIVQGATGVSVALSTHPSVRSICFTGSASAGRHLAQLLAGDFTKDLALELGGKNSSVVMADADVSLAAACIAEGMCLTSGQRCNATSHVLVHRSLAGEFREQLLSALAVWKPGDPLDDSTQLGPLITERALDRYRVLCASRGEGRWLRQGELSDTVDGLRGYFVHPAVLQVPDQADSREHPLLREEIFAPILVLQEFEHLDRAIEQINSTAYGLACSVFTNSEVLFWKVADEVEAGNVYANLPTTFSPSTLPFGGWKSSGNGKPGGRGFIRFVTQEQAVQMRLLRS